MSEDPLINRQAGGPTVADPAVAPVLGVLAERLFGVGLLGESGFDVPAKSGEVGQPIGAISWADSAQLIGGYRWVEKRLFEVVGRWVASEPVAPVRVLLDTASRQHGWHADLWAQNLPVRDGVDPEALTAPPNPEVEVLMETLASNHLADDEVETTPGASGVPILAGAYRGGISGGGTLQRLVGLGRVVLPRLVATYALHLARTSPVADAPIARTLRLILADEVETWHAVELTVQSLVRRPHDLAVVGMHQQRLEAIVAGNGPGLIPLAP